jgi:hypothetical protein
MQHLFSVLAAAAAFASPQTGMSMSAPVAVSTCAVTDLINPAVSADIGPTISYRMLRVTFTNTADAPATQVAFDVMHDGTHTTVTDRGRFTKGVAIEHLFDDFVGTYGGGDAVCSVAAITYADGRRWSASRTTAATALR